MREIKFRAWDTLENPPFFVFDIQKYKGDASEGVGVNSFDDFLHDDAYTVEQFTGVKDKNGKDIYEGDIVEFDFPDIGKQKAVVYFNGKYAAFLMNPLKDFQFAQLEDGVVVGNIHENLELLVG